MTYVIVPQRVSLKAKAMKKKYMSPSWMEVGVDRSVALLLASSDDHSAPSWGDEGDDLPSLDDDDDDSFFSPTSSRSSRRSYARGMDDSSFGSSSIWD